MTKYTFAPLIFACLTILVGCSIPVSSNPENLPDPTYIYKTISANLTSTAAVSDIPTATPMLEVNSTPTPEELPTPADSPVPTDLPVVTVMNTPILPCNRASAGKPAIDITIPDGSLMQPGEAFTKVWRLVNTGSCAWTRQYALVWFSGEFFGSSKSQNISNVVQSGDSVDFNVDMVAPQEPGIHQSNWKLRAEDGQLFGLGPAGDAPFWVRVEVEVVETRQAAPAPAVTLTPTPGVAVKGEAELSLNDSLDLDTGQSDSGNADDLALLMQGEETVLIMPINGARFSVFGKQPPTEADCSISTMSGEGIGLKSFPEAFYICYRTNQGLPGAGRISDFEEGKISVEYTTWVVP